MLNFDYSTVQSTVGAIFGSNNDVGKGIADLLVEKLGTAPPTAVVERKAIDKIIAEQNFSNSNQTDPNTAAKVGRILGVDAIIVGSITQFGRDDQQTNIGGGVVGGITSKYGMADMGKKSSKASVVLSARLVSTDTAEIFAVATGKGESTRNFAARFRRLLRRRRGRRLRHEEQQFCEHDSGRGVNSAVNGLAKQLDDNAQRLPTRKVVLDGLVADVNGDTIVINIGSKVGVKIGDTLRLKRVGREIRDPATGKVIRRDEASLAISPLPKSTSYRRSENSAAQVSQR